MKYNFDNLNSYDFEHLVQALVKKIIGNGATSFGDGTDGGREASFEGEAPFPSESERWSGYWVFQAKFKQTEDNSSDKDFEWVKTQLTNDLKKYETRKTEVRHPDNYVIFTNVVLTAKPGTGGRDKATQLEKDLEKEYGISHIRIIAYDDLKDYLNSYRDIAIAFAPFILPGDILYRLMDLLDLDGERKAFIQEAINLFLEVEFREDEQSKLDHAGKLTADKVNLEKVFIDLHATKDGYSDNGPKFIHQIIELGNSILKYRQWPRNKFVLVAGPGYGKSTLTQFLAQIHRAFFLKAHDKEEHSDIVDDFIRDLPSVMPLRPKWVRLPIRIVLKEYAGWVRDSFFIKTSNVSISSYISYCIERKTGCKLTIFEIANILKRLPCIIIFDGLDEVPISSNRAQVMEEIDIFTETILRRADSDCIIIATTRPQGYFKEFNIEKYIHLIITDLEKEDALLYLKRLTTVLISDLSERADKINILKRALADHIISRLMKSPLQASIMAILVKSGGEPPRNKFDLFVDYYNIIFRREKQRNISKILTENPDYIKEIHDRLGLYLQSASEKSVNPSASISLNQFREIIRKYLNELELEEQEVNSCSDQIIEAATQRLVFISELEDQKIGFAIRSLQEFFAANGYLHNVSDELIRARVKAVAESAYWNNTLLFAIGYISKNKNYLVDFVESLCYELNGSGEEGDVKTIVSISKMGSWLALDILNEGIFRGNPRYENRFCYLLKPLFEIAPAARHADMAKLPERFLVKWMEKYFDESLETFCITPWVICMHLYKVGSRPIEIMNKRWPTNAKNQNAVLKIFLDNAIEDKWVLEKSIQHLQLAPKSEAYSFFQYCSSDLQVRLIKSKQSKTIHNLLVEFTFLESLDNFGGFSSTKGSFTALGIDFKRNLTHGLLHWADESLTIDIIPGYYYELVRTKIQDYEYINYFKEQLESRNAVFASRTCAFLIDPTYKRYTELLMSLASQPMEYRSIIVDAYRLVNSFFAITQLREISEQEFSEIISRIENFEKQAIESNFDKSIQYKDYAVSTVIGVLGIVDRIVSFKAHLTAFDDNVLWSEFYSLLSWQFRNAKESDLKMLIDDQFSSVVTHAANTVKWNETEIDISILHPLLYFSSLNEICSCYLNHVELYDLPLFTYEMNRLSRRVNLVTAAKIFEKCCDLVGTQIINGNKPAYKTLLQNTIIYVLVVPLAKLDRIPFSHMTNCQEVAGQEKYKALLLLLDRNFDQTTFDQFRKILLAEDDIKLDYDYLKAILIVLERRTPHKSVANEIFVFLNNIFDFEFYELRSEFENLVRQYAGSQPTGIQIE